MKESDDVQQLLRLKRYESPGEEYFDSFLDDFKDRQRSELLCRSSRSILAERVGVWLNEMGSAKWLVPAGAAAAAIGVGVFMNTRPADAPIAPNPLIGQTDPVSDGDSAPPSEKPIILEVPKNSADGRVPSFSEEMVGSTGLLPAKGKNWEF